MSTLRTILRAFGLQALGGLAVWIVVAVAAWNVDTASLDLVTVLLLFAQLVVVPLGLPFLFRGAGTGLVAALLSGGRFTFRVGAVAALASLAVPEGELSAAVAALYLLPAGMVGLASLLRAASGPIWRASELAPSAAGVFLFIGALFFVFHRQGITFAGFHELVIQLTAVHFHFVGFGLLAMAGEAARRQPRIGGGAVLLLVAGMIVTPFSILAGQPLRAAAALAVVAGLGAVVVATLLSLPALSGASSRLLFAACALAVFIGAMAAMYAIGEASGRPPYPLEFMARMHGTIAAVGVVGCGLLGWRLAQDR